MAGITKRGLLVMGAGAMISAPAQAQIDLAAVNAPQPRRQDRALLRGAFDIHAHLDPDSYGPHSNQPRRALDVLEMAQRARRAGMRGFVIKQHYDHTAQLAYIARRITPEVEAYGMLCLNRPVGGLNPAAVHNFAEVQGGCARIVSMPTWHSENYVSKSDNPDRPSVRVSAEGQLLPETLAVIEAVAGAQVRDSNAKLALATGHVSAEEGLLVIREARRQGITNIVVTHPVGHEIQMSVAQMREAAQLGAYLEFVVGFLFGRRATFTTAQYYDLIRAVGPASIILSSDGGQAGRALPDDMMALAAGQLRDLGLSTAELQQMMVANPAALLSAS